MKCGNSMLFFSSLNSLQCLCVDSFHAVKMHSKVITFL